jgi:hypothetical protein
MNDAVDDATFSGNISHLPPDTEEACAEFIEDIHGDNLDLYDKCTADCGLFRA